MNKVVRLVLVVAAVIALSLGSLGVSKAQTERVVTMGSLVELYTIDPAVGFDQAIGSTLKQFYDTLFRYEGNPPKVVPWLAEKYEISADGLVYTITLPENVKFHDGSPLNAAAVVYSAERLLRVNQGAAGLFLGKQLGIFAGIRLAVAMGVGGRPMGASWLQVYGMAMLCGIGFTMSLFIGGLAFGDPADLDAVKIGVIGGSLLSAVAGYLLLRLAPPAKR